MPCRKLYRPTHSTDPVDWWMYCDLILDEGFPASQAGKARRIGDSLAASPGLTLALYCPPEYLDDHWLRIGRTWFIPVEGTHLDRKDRFAWWRPEWVRAGFARYPSSAEYYPARYVDEMIGLATGTPWQHQHPEFGRLRERHPGLLIDRFFTSHSLLTQPGCWL